MNQDSNVGKRFSRERFRVGKAGVFAAALLVVVVSVWLVYTTGFLRS